MAPRRIIAAAVRCLLLASAWLIPLTYPASVAAQTFPIADSCPANTTHREDAIDGLNEISIKAQQLGFVDIAQSAADAAENLAATLEVLNDSQTAVAFVELDEPACAEFANLPISELNQRLLCQELEVARNDEDAIEKGVEDISQEIAEGGLTVELQGIVSRLPEISCHILSAARILAAEQIKLALASGAATGSGSGSPSIDDALVEQSTADAQAVECLADASSQSCGASVASSFDALFNVTNGVDVAIVETIGTLAIIEIIRGG